MNTVDWVVVALYGGVVLTLGWVFSRRQSSDREFFLASRRMPAWAAAVSVVATSLSAVTFIGAPEAAYGGNLTYLATNLGAILAAVIVAALFVPAFYARDVTTVYGLLDEAYGRSTRRAASMMFLVGRVMASGARLFAASIPVSMMLFADIETPHLLLSIGLVALAAALYTVSGGIAAVMWTDALQLAILLGAALLAIFMLTDELGMSASEIVASLRDAEAPDGSAKLTLIDTRLDPSLPFTLPAILLGFTLFNSAALGADQDLAQRTLTCRSPARAAASVVGSQLLGAAVVLVFMTVGLLLYLRHAGEASPPPAKEVFLRFMLEEVPPGLRGLMMAGLLAAAMSSMDSALNAMASAAVHDVMPSRVRARFRDVALSRVCVVGFAAALAGFAAFCVFWQRESGDGLIEFALGVMIYAYGGTLAVFLAAMLTKRGTTRTALSALATGFVATGVMDALRAQGVVDLSLGWRMLVATSLAFVVCVSLARSGKGAPDDA